MAWVVCVGMLVHLMCHSWVSMRLKSHIGSTKGLVSWLWTCKARASLVKEDSIILAILSLIQATLRAETLVKSTLKLMSLLLFNLLSLLSWHELLGMLVRVSELTATFSIKIFLWAQFAVCRWLSER